jgi:hypothetical protein
MDGQSIPDEGTEQRGEEEPINVHGFIVELGGGIIK